MLRSGNVYLTSAELAWLGGLFEAEGSFMMGTPSQPRTPRLMIGMTDQDIIQRVSSLIGSSIKQFRTNQANLKPQYSVQVGGGSAISLMRLLLPLMGQRRQGQIERAMSCHTLIVNYPGRTFCLSDEPMEASEATDRQWLAGYLEGEGHFALRKFEKHSGIYRYAHIEVGSTDRDVIEHAQNIWHIRCGIVANIGTHQPQYEGSKLVHRIAAHGPKAIAVMDYVRPLMGLRRQAQIQLALSTVGHTGTN